MKVILSTPTRNMEISKSFFVKAGFHISETNNVIYFSDGPISIEIDSSKTSRPSLKMYGELSDSLLKSLEDFGKIIEKETYYLMADPSGTWVYLMKDSIFPIDGSSDASQSIFGQYAGISLECIDLEKTMAFYELLGFEKSMGSPEKGWVSMKNSHGQGISMMAALMCPHMFTNPSLTYFNSGNNLDNIDKIRSSGIDISEEITVFNEQNIVDNVVVHEPGGLGFFVFND